MTTTIFSPRKVILSNHSCLLLLSILVVFSCDAKVSATPVVPDSVLYNLTSRLFDYGYRPEVRPVQYSSTPTYLRTRLNLKSLDALDVKGQRLTQTFSMDIYWTDDYIQWDSAAFDEVKSIFVRPSQVWIPDLTVQQYVGSKELNIGKPTDYLHVMPNGRIHWALEMSIETACEVDITYYPYDRQACEWKFHPKMMDKNHVVFEDNFGITGVSGDDAVTNAEWVILDAVMETCDFVAPPGYNPNVVMSCQKFVYRFKRRSLFLSLTLVTPTLLLAFLSALVFSLPAESGEKVSLGVTLMLTFTFLLSILMDSLPGSSLQISVFMVYLVMLCACSALSVLLTVLVLSLHHRPDSLPLTKSARVFVRFLVSKGCLTRIQSQSQFRSGNLSISAVFPESRCFERKGMESQPKSEAGSTRISAGYIGRKTGSDNAKVCDDKGAMKNTWEGFEERPGSDVMTWRDVADGCDYVFSRLFLAYLIFSTLVFFLIMNFGI